MGRQAPINLGVMVLIQIGPLLGKKNNLGSEIHLSDADLKVNVQALWTRLIDQTGGLGSMTDLGSSKFNVQSVLVLILLGEIWTPLIDLGKEMAPIHPVGVNRDRDQTLVGGADLIRMMVALE